MIRFGRCSALMLVGVLFLHVLSLFYLLQLLPSTNTSQPTSAAEEYKEIRTQQLHLTKGNSTYAYHKYFHRSIISQDESPLTWITHASVDRLDYLHELLQYWKGRTAVSVFVNHDEVYTCARQIYIIALYSQCAADVQERVDFHILADSHCYQNLSETRNVTLDLKASCHERFNLPPMRAWKAEYPVQHLRNLGIENAETELIFAIDMDYIPNPDLLEQARLYRIWMLSQEKTVFVVPQFEFYSKTIGDEYPHNKTELKSLWDGKRLRIFHHWYAVGRRATDYERYWNATNPYRVSYEPDYEPFYIAAPGFPLLSYICILKIDTTNGLLEEVETISHKVLELTNHSLQCLSLYANGYSFIVLDRSFVIHLGWDLMNSKKTTLNNDRLYGSMKLDLGFKRR